MEPLTRTDLMSLEQYAAERPAFRQQVLTHKRPRRVAIGPHLNLYFEDRLTIQYQVQEMLRIERIFEADGIEEELEAYNPLIPDGSNLKCTAMLEYQDVAERKRQLALLRGIEDLVWVHVDGFERVYAIANEDLERSNEEKTSAVHFMRFELTAPMIAALRDGAALTMGVNHDLYRHQMEVPAETRAALLQDLG
ncbi:MAG: DUF3501 family protein [Xanthomonadales bacterium]|nr:DUF3501 family protein [Xanthomonadales bacterium]NIN60335.1 DUF3501 family protein [Xanthomonadales bacterium]NIN75687.1 DUF3501 family protein [Xanthomonadales bacterium]NIO14760.1 DUF3501 family protein [Xanthomonadales bacterium]NIP12728.1 DUF3501 family protein [Xanthomonadales bacterium]